MEASDLLCAMARGEFDMEALGRAHPPAFVRSAKRHGMLSLAAEIPGYLQGINPLSIEAVTRRLGAMLEWPVDLDKLRQASNAWEIQVSEAVEKDEKLAATIRKLEEEYDNELLAEDSNG